MLLVEVVKASQHLPPLILVSRVVQPSDLMQLVLQVTRCWGSLPWSGGGGPKCVLSITHISGFCSGTREEERLDRAGEEEGTRYLEVSLRERVAKLHSIAR